MLTLLRKLVGLAARRSSPPAAPATPAVSTAPASPGGAAVEADDRPAPQPHAARAGVALDSRAVLKVALLEEEQALFAEIERRIASGAFELPQLPATSLAVMALANDPAANVHEISELVQADPALSGQLVKTANSALYAGAEPVTSIHDGVMRLGLRALRGMILSASMRSIVLRGGGVSRYGDQVWRQAASVARIAKAIAPEAGYDREKAFLLGLLHDLGKFALLGLLAGDVGRRESLSPALVGKVFHRFHEPVGRALAERWGLGDEIVSVAGNHHAWAENADHPRSAALCSLAHKLDLRLSLDDEAGFRALAGAGELDVLGVPAAARPRLLDAARRAWAEALRSRPAAA